MAAEALYAEKFGIQMSGSAVSTVPAHVLKKVSILKSLFILAHFILSY